MEREQKQLANMMTNDKRHDLLSVNIHSTHPFTKKTLLAQGMHFYSAPHPKEIPYRKDCRRSGGFLASG
jgi:hypothetical protein